MEEKYLTAEVSAESELLADLEQKEAELSYQRAIETVQLVLGKLTEVQRRRFLMHRVVGLTTRQIAELEGSKQQSIVESLQAAEKKIKKFWQRAKNTLSKPLVFDIG